jgi:hypothetical protein
MGDLVRERAHGRPEVLVGNRRRTRETSRTCGVAAVRATRRRDRVARALSRKEGDLPLEQLAGGHAGCALPGSVARVRDVKARVHSFGEDAADDPSSGSPAARTVSARRSIWRPRELSRFGRAVATTSGCETP